MAKVSADELKGNYGEFIRRKVFILIGLGVILFALVVLSLSVGSSGMPVGDIIKALFGAGDEVNKTIIWNIRMPRIVTAVMVGVALSLAGCIMQNVLRNQLASASTLGVSQGASFGAAFAIVVLDAGTQVNASGASSSVSISNPYLVTFCAFLGGIATMAVILALSKIANVNPTTMILAGTAMSSLFSGGTTIIQYFADDVKVASVVHWTFGDLGRASWNEIKIIFILSLLAFVFFMIKRWDYNAMESGVQTAKSLGVNVDYIIVVSMLLCTLIAAVSTAFVGTISFIGLIAPHMVRRFVGNDYRFLIPGSALCGAVVLVLAELVSRTIISPSILPIGALTSFLGAPVFIYIIFNGGKK